MPNSSNQIIKNLVTLTSAEILSKAIALITAVYLARILKPEGFGILGFATAFVSYFLIVVDFGFNTYGTREVAKDKKLIEKLVNNILTIRLVFAVILFLIFAVVVLLIDKPETVKIVLLITGVNLFNNAITINWVFNGIEKMEVISIKQISANALALIGLLVFIHSDKSIIGAAIIISSSAILSSIGLIQFYRKTINKISFSIDLEFCKKLLSESLPILFSAFMIAIYYNLDMVMLGYMKTEADVGIYNAAYKILLVGIIPFTLILNSFFPTLSKIGLTKSLEFKKVISQYGTLLISSAIIISSIIFFNAGELIQILFGKQFLKASIPLSILSLNILVIGTNIFFGNPLIAWGKQKQYSFAIALGAVANIILNILLIPKYSYSGAAFSTLLSEVVVFAGVFILFLKNTIIIRST